MTRRLFTAFVLLCGLFTFDPKPAQAQQTFNATLGYFTVRGEDARVDGDVLNANRNLLDFEIKDFNGPSIGGEWLFPIGNYIEAGAGVSFTRRTVPTVYSRLVNVNSSEIEQDLKLRMVPVALTFRALPLGQNRGFQPYVGGGLNVIAWRYSESGQFVDRPNSCATPQGCAIFNNSYVASGTATGPVAMGGIRFAGDALASGFEIRYQAAKADLPEPFAGPAIDLGGWSYLFTIGARFGR